MEVVIATLDVPNKNNRVYSRSVIEDAIKPLVGTKMCGQVGMPSGDIVAVGIEMDKMSHVVENLRINDNNQLIGDVTILRTPGGNTITNLMETRPLDFRLSGVGQIRKVGDITYVSDLKIISINAVVDGA